MARVNSFLLLLATCILLVASIKEVQAGAVLDVDGDPLFPGAPYYVVSAIWGAGGGGLSYEKRDGILTVKQESSDLNKGHPLSFQQMTREGFVPTSRALQICFRNMEEPSCWKVTESNEKEYVTISTPNGLLATDPHLFQLKPASSMAPELNAYNIFYCYPKTADCSALGISDHNRWLEVSQRPLPLIFIKADKPLKRLEELK